MVHEQDAIVVLDEGVEESLENVAACCKTGLARSII
jgi:putative radical SAM-modified peptide